MTIIPPKPSSDGSEAKKMLLDAGLPVFATAIRRIRTSLLKIKDLQGLRGSVCGADVRPDRHSSLGQLRKTRTTRKKQKPRS